MGEFSSWCFIGTPRKCLWDPKAQVLSETLDQAISAFLDNKKSHLKVMELDNRGSHFYLAMYWAQSLASQSTDSEFKVDFLLLLSLSLQMKVRLSMN